MAGLPFPLAGAFIRSWCLLVFHGRRRNDSLHAINIKLTSQPPKRSHQRATTGPMRSRDNASRTHRGPDTA